MSIFSGFQNEIRQKILGVQGHITLSSRHYTFISDYESMTKEIRQIKGVKSVVAHIEAQGMLQVQEELKPVLIKAVPPSVFAEDEELSMMVELQKGQKHLSKKYQALVGVDLSKGYLLDLGSRLTLLLIRDSLSLDARPIRVKGQVVGVFKTGYFEMDSQVIYLSLRTLQSSFGVGHAVNTIDIKVDDIWKTREVIREIRRLYGYAYHVVGWEMANANLFKALRAESVMMWVVMTLILIVAIFNVMSSQIMLVIDKKKEIGILKTIGMSPRQVRHIFLLEGLMITVLSGVSGSLVGNVLARYLKQVLALIEAVVNGLQWVMYHVLRLIYRGMESPEPFYFFPKDIYSFESLPVDLSVWRSVLILVFALILSVMAGLIPSHQAGKMRPVEVMRYE